MIVVWVCAAVVFVLMFLDLNLVLLHVYLNVKKMTTYQLITLMREEERMEKIAEISRKRNEEEARKKVEEESAAARIGA